MDDTTAPLGESMRSGAITHKQTSTMTTTVEGPGTVSFQWKTSCEDSGGQYDWDHAEFEATITMGADGKPVVAHDPPLTEEEAAKRTYRTLGKKTLDPAVEWTDVTDESDLDAAGSRFFKVKVEMK